MPEDFFYGSQGRLHWRGKTIALDFHCVLLLSGMKMSHKPGLYRDNSALRSFAGNTGVLNITISRCLWHDGLYCSTALIAS